MVAGCGMNCLKYLIIFFNILFLIIGAAFIAAGIFILVVVGNIFKETNWNVIDIMTLPFFLMGILIMVPAFLGCCGACRENRCMLVTYAVIMGVLTLLEVILGIVGFVYLAKLRTTMETFSQNLFDNYDNEFSANLAVDLIQSSVSCCGIHGAADWLKKPNSTGIPMSCCVLRFCNTTGIVLDSDAGVETGGINSKYEIYTVGCLANVEAKLGNIIRYICGVLLGTAFVELLGILFAVCLIRAARDRD